MYTVNFSISLRTDSVADKLLSLSTGHQADISHLEDIQAPTHIGVKIIEELSFAVLNVTKFENGELLKNSH